MPDSPMLMAALRYAALGWHIFPCRAGSKEPVVRHGYKAASSDPEQIRKWWAAMPHSNIGLACGRQSGVSVADIDIDGSINKDGWETLKTYPPLPDTLISETPRGGAHFIFATDDPPANKNNFDTGIDIRGDGYYIVLPPSIHPNGQPYKWREGHDPWSIAPATYPDFLRPTVNPAPTVSSNPPRKTPPWSSNPRQAQSSVPPSVRERAILYLRECEPAIQGFSGHDKLLWAARAMTRGFCLPEAEALALLQSEYNPRCSPQWDLTNPRDAKDFARKVSEAIRTPGSKPEGWLLDDSTYERDDSRLEILGDDIAEALLREDQINQSEQSKTDPTPADLLTPPGLVGDICQWINETALKQQPMLSVAAALTFCGSIMGRKVRDEIDSRTNLYVMSVGESSAGKEHARKQIKRLAEEAGISSMLGGEDVTSDAAIEARLEAHPTTLFLWDEIGHMMQSIRVNGGNPHLSRILPTLMKLYSASSGIYLGKEYATGDRRTIDQPCCCLYGTTTPDKLADGISPSEIKDGFLGRVLVFITNDRPRKNRDRARSASTIPAGLAERVRQWWDMEVVDQGSIGNIAEVIKTRQVTVSTTPEAEARLIALDDLAERMMTDAKVQSKGVDRLWGKAEENARKIALIIACGCHDMEIASDPIISIEHADYACQLVHYIIGRLTEMIAENVSESSIEKDKQYITKIIKAAGRKGMKKRELTRQTQKFESRQRESYLRDLVDSNEIVIRTEGKTVRFYKYPWGL